MTKEEAQKTLDMRNGNFLICSYNGMRQHSKVMCLNCESHYNVSIDSLLRKSGKSFGCPECNFRLVKNKLLENSLEFISKNDDNTINVKCINCGSIITNKVSSLTNSKFLCKSCSEARVSKIINNQKLYSTSTINQAQIDWNIRCLIDTNSLEWYYILGFLMADGNFRSSNNRVRLRLQKSDKESICKIANIIGCSIVECKNSIGIDFCCNTIQNIIKEYSISDTKTYNPCDISSIKGKELVAFSIGFIDGDGCIGYRSDNKKPKITIKLHSSWYDNLTYISNELYNYFGIENYPHPIIVKRNNKRYAQITFGNQIILRKLFEFINENLIPVMERKWNKLEVMYL